MDLTEKREEARRLAVASRQLEAVHHILSRENSGLTFQDVVLICLEIRLSKEDPRLLYKMRKEREEKEDRKAGRQAAGRGRY